MLKRRIALMGAMLMAVLGVAVVAGASPASAACNAPDGHCNNLAHYSPDDGFDDPFGIKCVKFRTDGTWWLAQTLVYEGQNGYGVGCVDVKQVYLKAGTKIKCLDFIDLQYGIYTWDTVWDQPDGQWYDFPGVGWPWESIDRTCVYQLD